MYQACFPDAAHIICGKRKGGARMRAGKLKTRRYRVHRRGFGWVFLVLLGVALGAGAVSLRTDAWETVRSFSLLGFHQPAPTPTPESMQAGESTLTLPGHTWYALQLGVFNSADAAKTQAASFRGRGAGGYVLEAEGYRVLAAAYSSRADAQAVIHQLRTAHGVETVITEITQPEITLRLSGARGQLTALDDALSALEQLPLQLSALSDALDRRGEDRESVLSSLRSQRDTLTALDAQLETYFGKSAPAPVRDIRLLLKDLAQSLDQALSAQGSAALGAQVKYAHLQCLCRMAAFAQTLSEVGGRR